MTLEIELGVGDVFDDARLINHVRDAAWKNPKRRRHAERFTNCVSSVAEEREGKIVFGCEGFVGRHVISANSDHFSSRVLKGGVAIAKAARFLRTAGSVILWIEVQNDALGPIKAFQIHRLARLRLKHDVRNCIPNLNTHD